MKSSVRATLHAFLKPIGGPRDGPIEEITWAYGSDFENPEDYCGHHEDSYRIDDYLESVGWSVAKKADRIYQAAKS